MMGSPIPHDYADPMEHRRPLTRLRRFFMSALSALAIAFALVMAGGMMIFSVVGMWTVLDWLGRGP